MLKKFYNIYCSNFLEPAISWLIKGSYFPNNFHVNTNYLITILCIDWKPDLTNFYGLWCVPPLQASLLSLSGSESQSRVRPRSWRTLTTCSLHPGQLGNINTQTIVCTKTMALNKKALKSFIWLSCCWDKNSKIVALLLKILTLKTLSL